MTRRPADPNDRLAVLLARAGPDEESPRPGAGDRPVSAGHTARDGPVVLDADLEEPYTPDLDLRPERPSGVAAPRVLTLPVSVRGALTRPAGGAVAGFAAVVLLAALVFGARAWWAGRDAALEPVLPASGSTGPASASAVDAAATGTGPRPPAPGTPPAPAPAPPTPPGSPPQTPVYVHVVGKVTRPGVITVSSGARVVDALASSGGAARGADLTTVNLARPVVDGEQIVVLGQGQSPPPTALPAAPAAPATSGAARSAAPTPVNINTADATTLETLPGVGPVLAERIVQWRAAHGRFSSIEELGEVSGVGPKTLEQLTPLVTL